VAPAAPGDDAFAAFDFAGPIREAVHRLKYGARPDLAVSLGELMNHALGSLLPRVDVVVPVPLHPLRLTSRGYNQAALLAAPLARGLGVPLSVRVVSRVAFVAAQARLNREQRDVNVHGAFAVPRPARARGKHILLVDDVVTTGSTFDACRAVLLEAGASAVTCVALARARKRAAESR